MPAVRSSRRRASTSRSTGGQPAPEARGAAEPWWSTGLDVALELAVVALLALALASLWVAVRRHPRATLAAAGAVALAVLVAGVV